MKLPVILILCGIAITLMIGSVIVNKKWNDKDALWFFMMAGGEVLAWVTFILLVNCGVD